MVTAERQSGSGGVTTESAATTTSTQQQPGKSQGSGGSVPLPATASSSLLVRPLPAVRASAHPQEPPAPRHAPPRPGARRRQGQRTQCRSLWREPMTAAVLVGTVLVSLLCVYVYAYARVAAAGFEASRMRRALAGARQEEQNLRARISTLSLPGTVASRAKSLGMEMAPPEATQVLSTSEPAAASRQP